MFIIDQLIFLAVDFSPTFLNTGTTDKTFQQSGNEDSFRHILKSLASMYESSGSQFFRTTTGIYNQDQVPLMNQGLLLPF